MRRIVAVSCAAASLLLSVAAGAQPKKDPNKPGRIVVSGELNSSAAAQNARARAARGDCMSALDAFDEALRTSIDPLLHRDRGICHDRLGHPFPAMDDYRAYLTASPNAPDAEKIRARLEELESANGIGGKSDTAKSEPEPAKPAASGSASGSASFSASASTKDGGKEESSYAVATSSDSPPKDTLDAEIKEDEADKSPLRRGTGFIIGPLVGFQAWTGDRTDAASLIAATLRYSFSAGSTILADVGYTSIGRDTSALNERSGVSLYGAYEARLRLDERTTNAILLVGGLGYERVKLGGQGLTFSIIHPKVRGGFRHVFGANLGLEGTIEAGYAFIHAVNVSEASIKGPDTNAFVIGGTIALVLGF